MKGNVGMSKPKKHADKFGIKPLPYNPKYSSLSFAL